MNICFRVTVKSVLLGHRFEDFIDQFNNKSKCQHICFMYSIILYMCLLALNPQI